MAFSPQRDDNAFLSSLVAYPYFTWLRNNQYRRWYSVAMPARPRWHAKLDDIRQSLTDMDVPVIDRPTIEQLFGVGRRQANNLIRIHHGYQLGASKVVARDKLLAGLEKMGAHRGVATAETTRKSRLIEALEAIQRRPRPRRIVLPPPLPPRPASTSLPPGFTVSS